MQATDWERRSSRWFYFSRRRVLFMCVCHMESGTTFKAASPRPRQPRGSPLVYAGNDTREDHPGKFWGMEILFFGGGLTLGPPVALNSRGTNISSASTTIYRTVSYLRVLDIPSAPFVLFDPLSPLCLRAFVVNPSVLCVSASLSLKSDIIINLGFIWRA